MRIVSRKDFKTQRWEFLGDEFGMGRMGGFLTQSNKATKARVVKVVSRKATKARVFRLSHAKILRRKDGSFEGEIWIRSFFTQSNKATKARVFKVGSRKDFKTQRL